MNHPKAEDGDDVWDSDTLGRDEKFARVVNLTAHEETQIDEAIGVTTVALRLDRDLIDECKRIAKLKGLPFKVLMKRAIIEFVDKNKLSADEQSD